LIFATRTPILLNRNFARSLTSPQVKSLLLSAGRIVSHYEILEHLDSGGMGEVYKARDQRLGRTVALKFLPKDLTRSTESKNRFMQEARLLSSLQHENICVLHDIDESEDGRMFISMEYLDGITLKEKIAAGPLSVDEALGIASQLARGLARAHDSGITHRDIKPANIIITEDRQAKILDFGLSEALRRPAGTKAVVLAGTPAYMSPEQARGEPTDHRTDIWSLGVVLYEMVTGRRPFGGEYEQATIYTVIHEPHRPASEVRNDIPVSLSNVIDRCLDKSVEARFPNATSLVDALNAVRILPAAAPVRTEATIAVLPFQDIGPEQSERYFSDGLREEIVAKLSRLRKVRIVSHASAMNYDQAGKTVKRIAAELGAQFLLQGSVRRQGNAFRITTHLVDGFQETHLWSETYDGTMNQIFDIQEDVAQRITKALRVRLSPDEKRTLRRKPTLNSEAYQLYLKGRFFWNKRNKEDLFTSIRYFEDAVDRDPRFALAWVGLSDAYSLLNDYEDVKGKETLLKARQAVERALKLDERLAEAHASLGIILMLRDWDWSGAEKEYKLAIRLNPNYATAHHWYSEWCVCRGKIGEAIAEISRAVEIEPLSAAIQKDKGMILYYSRDYDGAIEWARKALELNPAFASPHRLLSMAYQAKRMHNEAIEENQKWRESAGNEMEASAAHAHCLAVAGRVSEARQMLESILRSKSAGGNLYRGIALVYAAMGDNDNAFSWLEKGFAVMADSLCMTKVDPKLDSLRADSRYTDLIRRVGLD
jgi:serine/threonine protein kinase/Flp pilus assembly protein TadD